MMKMIMGSVLALSFCAGLMMGQGKQLQPKSKGEYEAIVAIQQAQTPDERIKAIETLLTKYADTAFKPMALEWAAAASQQKGDADNMIIYAERALEANPKSYNAMLMLAQAWASRTREFDLDKEEKLGRAEKYAKDAIEILKTTEKPNPQITDAQWDAAKKDFAAQGYEALGSVAMVRKKFDVAIAQYKLAVEGASSPDPATMVRLASAYSASGKNDEALALLDKVIAIPDAHPQVKQVAQNEKARLLKIKATGAPKPAPAANGVPQVEIKK